MRIHFEYSIEGELTRIMGVLRDVEFFKKFGYKVSLPKGLTLDNLGDFSEAQLRDLVMKEFLPEDTQKAEQTIRSCTAGYEAILEEYFNNLPGEAPPRFRVKLTKYGSGGSYYLPNMVVINFIKNHKPFTNFVHEATHCIIEEAIVNKYKLTQKEKESVVNWLMIENEPIHKLLPWETYSRFGPPSKKLLKKVGLMNIHK